MRSIHKLGFPCGVWQTQTGFLLGRVAKDRKEGTLPLTCCSGNTQSENGIHLSLSPGLHCQQHLPLLRPHFHLHGFCRVYDFSRGGEKQLYLQMLVCILFWVISKHRSFSVLLRFTWGFVSPHRGFYTKMSVCHSFRDKMQAARQERIVFMLGCCRRLQPQRIDW